MTELFQDISNQPQLKQQAQVLKTFERRHRVATIPEEGSPTPGEDAASPCSSSGSPAGSLQEPCHASDYPASAAGGLSKRGRRSSVLRAAALPGHKLFSSSVQTSRSLLLAKMSKARRKAYMAYTQQMAEYFAEVDQFELVVESPTAATDSKARSRLPHASAASAKPTPQVWGQLQQRPSRQAPAATPASLATSPAASALLSATPPSTAPFSRSSSAVSEEPDESLVASPVSPQQLALAAAAAVAEDDLCAATPAVPDTAAPVTEVTAAAAAAEADADTVEQQQQEEDAAPGSAAPVGSSGRTSLLADTPLQQAPGSSTASDTPTATPVPAAGRGQQQQGAQDSATSSAAASTGVSGLPQGNYLDWLPSVSSSLGGLSLASATPAGPQSGSDTAAAAAAAAPGAGAGARLLAATPADSSTVVNEVQSLAASPAADLLQQRTLSAQEAAAGHHSRLSGLSSSSQASLASITPAVSVRADGQQQQQHSSSQASLVSTTPAITQQADMQQLMHQMQEMLLAVTPEGALVSGHTALQQQQQPPSAKQAPDDQETADAPAAEQAAGKQQRKAKQKADRKKQGKTAAVAAATNTVGVDEQRQQQEQQQLAEQHYQSWLQQQAEAAAAAELEALELEASADAELSALQQMLKACGQPVSLADIPAMCDFLADVVDLRDVAKIGEGTYGEAFKSGQVVLKFVPMEGSNLINGWPQKGAGDLLGEAIIARALTDLGQDKDDTGAPHASYTDAFVQTHRVGVCRGPYPAAFVKAWKAWDKRHKSENDFIGGLPDEQLYAVFAMANCGRDLESYQLQGYEQVRSLMLQTALALAVAEEAVAFEHRDLHWGNIMLSPPHDTHITARLKGCTIRVRAEGARVRLIDFTASRLQTPGGDVVFCDLEGEDGLFDGPKGKPQFETYRRMRKLTRKDWTGSHPGTNVLWLLYLTELLLSSEKPVPGASAAQKRNLREFKKRLGGYSNCSEVIWDELFEGLWASV